MYMNFQTMVVTSRGRHGVSDHLTGNPTITIFQQPVHAYNKRNIIGLSYLPFVKGLVDFSSKRLVMRKTFSFQCISI